MKWYDSVDNGYNTSEYGSGDFKRSEETRRKISEARTGKKNPLIGMTGEKAYWYGKHLSEEHRKKLSEAMGVNGILQYSKDGELIAEYPSTHEASRQTGCNQSNICQCCKGKYKTAGGYIW